MQTARQRSPISPIRDGVLAGVVVFLVSCLGVWLTYERAAEAQFRAVQGELLQLGRTAATLVDPDIHEQLRDTSQTGSAAHLGALEPLVAFHKATQHVIYLYTARRTGDTIQFVLGTDYLYRVSGDELPADPIGTVYAGQDPFFRQAFDRATEQVADHVVQERHRSYVSAYVPLRDASGRFYGVLGIDMVADDFEDRMRGVRLAAQLSGLAVTVLAIIAGFVAYRFRRAQARAWQKEAEHAEQLRHALARAQEFALLAEQHATEAERANRSKSEFLAMMSHELRTPMHGVLATTSLLQEKHKDAANQRLLGLIERSGNSLLRIINELLDLAQMEAGVTRFHVQPVAVRPVIQDVVDLQRASAQAKGVALALDIAAEVPEQLATDGERLRQVLTNLIGNAIKFTERGQVTVQVRVHEDRGLRVDVGDTGIGIPLDAHDRLFRSFSQVDASSRRRFGGTGLGLAISQKLVTLAGGEIGFDSAEGEGSTFWFTWGSAPES
ncbi:MAG: hypothetical protein IPK97_04160 [Ahniella sp.]|nr:hypothetical protein [Ahniella sp.]